MRSGVAPARKVPLAIELWKHFASTMEAQLAFRGIDLGDWHRGTLSSRKLLVLCEHIPELGGRWPMMLRVLKEAHKELALHRAALYVGGRNEYVPKLFLDPAEAREMADKARAEATEMQEATDELFAGLGFT